MAANGGVSDRVFQRHGRWKSVQEKDVNKLYTLMTIWIEDFLLPNSLGFKPFKLLVSIYRAFAQYFVTLYRGGSRQALSK